MKLCIELVKKTINNRETYTEIKIEIIIYFLNIFTEYIEEMVNFFSFLNNTIQQNANIYIICTPFIFAESKWI